jgi:hypothetical protein
VVIAVALVVLIVGGAATLKLLFPPEKLRAMVVPQLEARLGRDVELSAVRLRVFPRLAVRLEDLAIANPPGFSADPALEMDALDLQVRFWPLIRRQVELGRVRLVRPTIRYEVREDGISNYQGFGSIASAEGTINSGTEAAAAAGFVVEDLVLNDGTVLYSDARSGRRARMQIAARLSAIREPGGSPALRSAGEIEVAKLRALIANLSGDSIAFPDLAIDYEALADLPGDSLVLTVLQVEVGQVPLSGSGIVRGLRGARTIDFALESGAVDIAELLAGLPAELRPADVAASGTARLALKATGPVGEGAVPQIDGSAQLDQVAADYGEYGRLLSKGVGQIKFDLSSLSLSPFEGEVMGRPFQLELEVTQFQDLVLSGRLSGSFDLATVERMRKGSRPMKGDVAIDLEFSGQAKDRASLRLTGPLRLSNVSLPFASLAVPAVVRSASLQLTGAGIRGEAIPIELGQSDLTLSMTSRNLVTFALSGDGTDYMPFIEFNARSRRFDMSEILTDTSKVGYGSLMTARLAGRRVGGRDPGEIARERYRDLALPPVNASGHVEIGEFLNPPTRARDVGFDVSINNGVLQVRDLRGQVYGGQVTGGLVLDFSSGQPPFALRYNLSLNAAQAANFLQRWTRLGPAVNGLMDFDISGSGTVDETLLPAPDAIDATGQATFRNGRFQDFGLAKSLANQFKVDSERLAGFQALGGAFAIERGSVLLDGWELNAPDLRAGISGSAGLGGSLDLKLALEVPPSTLRNAGLVQGTSGLGDLLGQLADDDRPIQLGVGVGGTMSNPTLQMDTEALQQELAKRLQGSGKSLLDRLLKKPPPN